MLKKTIELLPCSSTHLQLQRQKQQHLNQPFTSSIVSAKWKQWLVPFLLSIHFLFFLAQPMIVMCKELAKDSAALKRLHMFRTTARFDLLSFS